MPKKLNQAAVEQIFRDKGCELLDTYTGNMVSMKYRCRCGKTAQTSLVGFRRSNGCYHCSEASGGRRFSYDQVKSYFAEQDCELLTTDYVNSVTPIEYRCVCGTVATTTFGNFREGRRCQTCKGIASSERLRTTEEALVAFCESKGCQFIRSWIKGKRTRIEYICKCGRPTQAYWTNFSKFPNCKKCGAAKISGDKCWMYDPDREAVAMRKKFRKICGQHIHRFMKATAQKKTKHTHELLGYHPMDLQEHILNHPDYKLCIGKEWHVDHIFPIQAFLDHKIFDLKVINRLDNLRPMLGLENLSKADKYDEKEFVEWLRKRSIKSGNRPQN